MSWGGGERELASNVLQLLQSSDCSYHPQLRTNVLIHWGCSNEVS